MIQRAVSHRGQLLGRTLCASTRSFGGSTYGVTTPGGVTNTEKFKELYHNTDSVDGYYDKVRKPRERIDPTKRAAQYLVVGTTRMFAVTFGRLCIIRFVQFWSAGLDLLAMASTEVELQ